MYSEFRTKLITLADENYRNFSMKSIPCERPFLGVRIPEIRKLTKEIPPENFAKFLNESPVAIEEVLARGFLIARLDYETMLKYFDSQVELLDNWCTVDTFVAALRKSVKNHESDFLEQKVKPLLESKNEFALRTGLVCLLDFYVKSEYLELIFAYADKINSRILVEKSSDSNKSGSPKPGESNYYVKMALAWLFAECFIKYPDETHDYLSTTKLDRWTYNKTISKICDSYRVDKTVKQELRRKVLK